jgi:hypothetical protein
VSTRVEVAALPDCDLCKLAPNATGNVAAYDAKTNRGPWAYLCESHWLTHRAYPDLGTGKGQRLVLRKDTP